MIKHIKCDIFESGADVICHQVNCQGVMGSGIAKQVKEKYPWVYKEYLDFCKIYKGHEDQMLGKILSVPINETQTVCNCFGQFKYGYNGDLYTNYNALCNIFNTLRYNNPNKIIAIPYLIGCARGGGDWNVVYEMIEAIFEDYNGEVLICEYNGG